jgi:DNA-binding NtrC family response regulator
MIALEKSSLIKQEAQEPAIGRILIVDDHPAARESMGHVLSCAGHAVVLRASAAEALQAVDQEPFDVVLTDLMMPGMNGLEFLRALADRRCDSQIAMITAHASVATAVEAMRLGAFDYIEKPFGAEQLENLVAAALARGANHALRLAAPGDGVDAMVGQSQPLRQLREAIAQIAPTSETVLITGESGVGKELVAQALHQASRRAGGPLVSLNCPTLSPQLMESELFGHERGAFTSADSARVGRFELADGGTIFLDEVSEIDLPLQAKLLRVLQEKSFERVGSSESQRVDVRVIAATNRDLKQEVAAGRFREDLYFRLAVVPLRVPALRERLADVPILVDHFLRLAAARLERPPRRLSGEALALLMRYDWPGNVRELENLVTRASVLGGGGPITECELRPWLIDGAVHADAGEGSPPGEAPQSELAAGDASTGSLHEMERALIEATLDKFDGHRAKTARALGIGVRTLSNKLRAYGYAPRAKTFGKAA